MSTSSLSAADEFFPKRINGVNQPFVGRLELSEHGFMDVHHVRKP